MTKELGQVTLVLFLAFFGIIIQHKFFLKALGFIQMYFYKQQKNQKSA